MTILFDLDGTLIDSTEAILESFHNSFDLHKHPHPKDEEIKALIGHPLDVMYAELGIEEAKVWDFVHTYKEHYREISTQKTVLLPEAIEAVEEAKKFARLGIVTTKTGKYSRVLMEHFGLMHHFDVLIGREDVQNPKPHAEPIDRAIAQMQGVKEKCWMIGDTRLDIASANNAGIKSIGVLSGYDNLEQLQTLTNIIENNALQAVKYIAKLA
ncbi:HAD family hydrolase [Sulfurimonas sp. HSL3-7]|uniref:HAD family hydrolase n=1 Tax=Sulfonitrofixus jiaomeiensis TaxID=3131938 RepID=UPI0031F9E2C4